MTTGCEHRVSKGAVSSGRETRGEEGGVGVFERCEVSCVSLGDKKSGSILYNTVQEAKNSSCLKRRQMSRKLEL
jgi:hypothetical protein